MLIYIPTETLSIWLSSFYLLWTLHAQVHFLMHWFSNVEFSILLHFKLSRYSALRRPNATKRSRTALCYVTTFGEIYLSVCVFVFCKALCLPLWIRICHWTLWDICPCACVCFVFEISKESSSLISMPETLLFRGRQLNLNFSSASVIPVVLLQLYPRLGPCKDSHVKQLL